MTLYPPGYSGYLRGTEHGTQNVNLGVSYGYFEMGNADSYQERGLNETIAALKLMHVPEGLK